MQGPAERRPVKQLKPYVTLADNEGDRRIDGFAGAQIANHLNPRPHFGEDDVLLIHNRLFELWVFGVTNSAAKLGAVERVKQIDDAGGAGDMLRAGLLDDVDARLKMFTGV